VPEYRAYYVGSDGHFTDAVPMICADDAVAIKQAEQIVNGRAIELWSGERFVIKLKHRPTPPGAPAPRVF
jgi:hypothetical protein